MQIYPAIDIRAGRCVRLIQGDYGRELRYADDPVAVARRLVAAGARWLHVIDLDAARAGSPQNLPTIARLIEQRPAAVQVGGGIRNEGTIERLLAMGARRVIVGTRALQDWDWFERLVHQPQYSGRIALGLDARGGKLAVAAWTETTEQSPLELVRAVAGWPLGAIIYTDIERDGTLGGPDTETIEALARAGTAPIIASGGIASLDDVRRLARLPIEGMVIGRALYEGRLELAEALAVAAEADRTG